MENLLRGFRALNGVRRAYLYREPDGILGGGDTDCGGLLEAAGAIDQIFAALQAIGKPHNELYLSLPDAMLAAYPVEGCCTVLLFTDRKVNFPLIHMGVKSAGAKLRAHFAPVPDAAHAPAAAPPHPAAAARDGSAPVESAPTAPPPAAAFTPGHRPAAGEAALRPVLDALSDLLLDHFGPAAHLVFDDALDEWRRDHPPVAHTLDRLVALLLKEFDSDAERGQFQRQAAALIGGRIAGQPTR